jgi:hypothetical protein
LMRMPRHVELSRHVLQGGVIVGRACARVSVSKCRKKRR